MLDYWVKRWNIQVLAMNWIGINDADCLKGVKHEVILLIHPLDTKRDTQPLTKRLAFISSFYLFLKVLHTFAYDAYFKLR